MHDLQQTLLYSLYYKKFDEYLLTWPLPKCYPFCTLGKWCSQSSMWSIQKIGSQPRFFPHHPSNHPFTQPSMYPLGKSRSCRLYSIPVSYNSLLLPLVQAFNSVCPPPFLGVASDPSNFLAEELSTIFYHQGRNTLKSQARYTGSFMICFPGQIQTWPSDNPGLYCLHFLELVMWSVSSLDSAHAIPVPRIF